ncbi:hypothetical protein, partial [Pseudomonas aeruginosa]
RGVAANSEPNSVITWPEGNGFLVDRLKAPIQKQIRVNSLVTEVKRVDNKIHTTVMNSATRSFTDMISDFVIFAAPRFVASHVFP